MAYDFDAPVSRRGTGCVKWDAYPADYLPMFIADSDFAVPEAITRAIIRRAEHPVYGYSLTSAELFDAFLGWYAREYNVTPARDWLEPMSGIVPALAVASTIREGRSLTVTPNYPMLLNGPSRAGREMITVPLHNENEVYTFDFDALQRSLTPDTRLFYLCNPQNPVGRVYTREELLQLSEFARENSLIVISDEIHCELVYDRRHTPFWTVDAYARDHSISFYAPGKTYNIPGCAAAFALIPNHELKEQFCKAGFAMGHPGIFESAATAAAYRDGGVWRDALLDYLRGNRDCLEAELRRRFPKASFPHTEGTYLQWINYEAYGLCGGDDFQRRAKLILNDGAAFGAPGYVRLNFACSRATLYEALDRIEQAISSQEEG